MGREAKLGRPDHPEPSTASIAGLGKRNDGAAPYKTRPAQKIDRVRGDLEMPVGLPSGWAKGIHLLQVGGTESSRRGQTPR
jgi:hypothetical protein